MVRWFTLQLEVFECDEDEDRRLSSPHRIYLMDGIYLVLYRLTPDTLDWINRMMQRAEKRLAGKGFQSESKLLEFKKRHEVISNWAATRFSKTEMEEAAKRAAPLPVEPSFSWRD